MSTLEPARLDIEFLEGVGFDDTFYWTLDGGFTYWFSGRTYPANAVVKSWPDPDPTTSLFFRALVGGTVAALPPTWPTQPGQTVVNGGVTWQGQTDSRYPLDLTGVTSAVMKFKSAPDAVGPEMLALTIGAGLTLGGAAASVRIQITPAQVAALLAQGERGALSMHATFGGFDPECAFFGDWRFKRLPSGR